MSYLPNGSEDQCQRVYYRYDGYPYDAYADPQPILATSSIGRLTGMSWSGGPSCIYGFQEEYAYDAQGLPGVLFARQRRSHSCSGLLSGRANDFGVPFFPARKNCGWIETGRSQQSWLPMSLMTNMQITAVMIGWIAFAAPHGQGRLEEHGGARRFVSDQYGFSIAVPSGWHVSLEKDTPMFINFSSARGLSQLAFPKGGASIVVVAQDTLPRQHRLGNTPPEWAVANARGVSAGSPSIKPLDMPIQSEVSRAVVSSYDDATFSPDDQAQHSVAAFWEFNRRLFSAHLTYVASDPNGPALQKLFLETVRSIRPLEKSPKH